MELNLLFEEAKDAEAFLEQVLEEHIKLWEYLCVADVLDYVSYETNEESKATYEDFKLGWTDLKDAKIHSDDLHEPWTVILPEPIKLDIYKK